MPNPLAHEPRNFNTFLTNIGIQETEPRLKGLRKLVFGNLEESIPGIPLQVLERIAITPGIKTVQRVLEISDYIHSFTKTVIDHKKNPQTAQIILLRLPQMPQHETNIFKIFEKHKAAISLWEGSPSQNIPPIPLNELIECEQKTLEYLLTNLDNVRILMGKEHPADRAFTYFQLKELGATSFEGFKMLIDHADGIRKLTDIGINCQLITRVAKNSPPLFEFILEHIDTTCKLLMGDEENGINAVHFGVFYMMSNILGADITPLKELLQGDRIRNIPSIEYSELLTVEVSTLKKLLENVKIVQSLMENGTPDNPDKITFKEIIEFTETIEDHEEYSDMLENMRSLRIQLSKTTIANDCATTANCKYNTVAAP